MPTILMMDDDKDFSSLVHANFTGQGYNVVLAHSGREGLAKAAAAKPDIIFLDIMMPDMNGIEVLRELQAADETSDIPVIIMSGKYVDRGMTELFAQERNFKDFMPKPVSFANLQRRVKELLKK
ncbi:MAG: response regulator [Elusimicrobia bacterium]|nr:response regulator [Elusimicrobiota bacterium]